VTYKDNRPIGKVAADRIVCLWHSVEAVDSPVIKVLGCGDLS
jgi:hypothetical protein